MISDQTPKTRKIREREREGEREREIEAFYVKSGNYRGYLCLKGTLCHSKTIFTPSQK